ncbi:MAG: putative ABC transporter permease [Acetatifactor muris]|nr:putative ABC transporter permease [Acetatifactor muris]MCM1526621.1 putative ABC transporter permease [Bacteroides sp.]
MADVMALGTIAVVVSFLGFVVENVWLAVSKGYIDNRGMCFPFLFGYGAAFLMIYMILGTPKKLCFLGRTIRVQNKIIRLLVYIVGVMLCICIGEIMLGIFVEKACHFCWWDYSEIPLHITRYTSIPTSIAYSLIVTLFMEVFSAPLYRFFQQQNFVVLCIVTVLLFTLMTADFIYNAYMMYRTHGLVRRWRVAIRKKSV